MESPLVSIIIPTLEAAEFLAEAVDSIFAQTYTNWELILVDAGSTDGTHNLYHHYQELDRRATKKNRLSMLIEPSLGIADARTLGIQKANGKYLMNMGADDILPPGRLQEQVSYLEAHPEIDVVYSDYLEIDYKGRPMKIFQSGKIEPPKTKLSDVLEAQIVPDDTMLAKRELYLKWPYRSYQGIYADDHYLIVKWFTEGVRFHKLDNLALMKRYHDGQHYRVHFDMYSIRSQKLKEIFNNEETIN